MVGAVGLGQRIEAQVARCLAAGRDQLRHQRVAARAGLLHLPLAGWKLLRRDDVDMGEHIDRALARLRLLRRIAGDQTDMGALVERAIEHRLQRLAEGERMRGLGVGVARVLIGPCLQDDEMVLAADPLQRLVAEIAGVLLAVGAVLLDQLLGLGDIAGRDLDIGDDVERLGGQHGAVGEFHVGRHDRGASEYNEKQGEHEMHIA